VFTLVLKVNSLPSSVSCIFEMVFYCCFHNLYLFQESLYFAAV
jgi:hypothetical protein